MGISLSEKIELLHRFPENFYVPSFRIAGNLYFVGNKDAGAYLLDTEEGLVLIDTTYPQTAFLLIQSIWELGFRPQDIRHILHTHGHFDHFGATAAIQKLYGSKTYLSDMEAVMFRDYPALSLIEENGCNNTKLFEPDILLKDGEWLRFGSTRIHCVLTPGHSPGTMSYFFEVNEKEKVYRVGLFGGAGFNTLKKDYFIKYSLGYGQMLKMRAAYVLSINKVLNEKVDINIGNHTDQSSTLEKRERFLKEPNGPNPFINPAEWKCMLEGYLFKMQDLRKTEANEIF